MCPPENAAFIWFAFDKGTVSSGFAVPFLARHQSKPLHWNKPDIFAWNLESHWSYLFSFEVKIMFLMDIFVEI